ncbi:type II secretion system GspH family protein [Photobacterium sp. WH77]|uniref:PilW family protein n=1 Tax=unclassified Photobacterium TaxID=2628852 RepID=UPI001EDA10E5|nr:MULTISPECIES: type II secretion system protein [unclassified Photobacterium]MCG2836544.1 type II secretion system GspH family protein [Photobacterium sp. WH77]MCG2844329.1 type II secretion system GspH family protein [Photobacterium sp. WH80]
MRLSRGFTLIEMIMALVILAFISLGIGAYLQLGAGGYSDTIDRERLQSEARFVIERLTREIRHAAPNSVSFSSGCLSFYPVLLTATYLNEPDPDPDHAKAPVLEVLVPPDSQQISLWNSGVNGNRAAVGFVSVSDYQADEDASIVVGALTKAPTTADPTASLQLSQWLGDRSPGQRLYLFSDQVAFCQVGDSLVRRVNNGTGYTLTNTLSHFNVAVSGAGLNSNGLIHLELTFSDPVSQESSDYSQSVQVINVL